MQKKCKKCQIEKSIDCFSKQKTNKDGYKNSCKPCVAEYGKKYRENNLEKEKDRSSKYYKNNYDNILEYRRKNKEGKKEYAKKYRENNKELLSIKQKINYINKKDIIKAKVYEYQKKRISEDPLFKLNKDIKSLIRDAFRRKNLHKGNQRTIDILGCSVEDFKIHLESQFENWMNWENKGLYNGTERYGWDIDHIIPITTGKTIEEVTKLNHYTNLRPLCGYYNRVIKRASSF